MRGTGLKGVAEGEVMRGQDLMNWVYREGGGVIVECLSDLGAADLYKRT